MSTTEKCCGECSPAKLLVRGMYCEACPCHTKTTENSWEEELKNAIAWARPNEQGHITIAPSDIMYIFNKLLTKQRTVLREKVGGMRRECSFCDPQKPSPQCYMTSENEMLDKILRLLDSDI